MALITYVGQTSKEPDPRNRKKGKKPKVEKSNFYYDNF